ncbi:MAG: 30S ribosomal protein S9 [Candidatus Thermoplasmatota archaeon]|nr:30S ribosomal protein S9 [Candidatus Thermoplasmatota archaeon]
MKVINSSGKRKTAIARATIKDGKGRIKINSVPLEILEPELARLKMMQPLEMVGDRVAKVDIDVNVNGGGVMGQATATRTAIARGLVDYFEDEELRAKFKAFDRSLLVNDPRRSEPKHPLGRGARKKRQKSYR